MSNFYVETLIKMIEREKNTIDNMVDVTLNGMIDVTFDAEDLSEIFARLNIVGKNHLINKFVDVKGSFYEMFPFGEVLEAQEKYAAALEELKRLIEEAGGI